MGDAVTERLQGPQAEELLRAVNESPFMRWAGLRLVEARPGYTRIELDVEPHHRSGGGTAAVNGGIMAYMVDASAGMTLFTTWTGREAAQVTIDLHITYLRPAYTDRVIAEGRLLHRGKTVGIVETELRTAEGELCAKGKATFRIFDRPLEAPA